MISLNMRCKSAALAAMMVVSSSSFGSSTGEPAKNSQVGTLASVTSFAPGTKAAIVITAVTVIAMWIRLNTKGSSFNYKLKDWRSDFELFLKSLNIFDAESRAVLMMLFDKWVIGRQFSILDISTREEKEDGSVVTVKDKRIKAKPFGLMGYVDAYVLLQLKKINEHVKEINSMCQLLKDPVTKLTVV